MRTIAAATPMQLIHLDVVRSADQALADARDDIKTAVSAALTAGCTYRQVGEVLGVSTQSAWQRFRPAPPPKPVAALGVSWPVLEFPSD